MMISMVMEYFIWDYTRYWKSFGLFNNSYIIDKTYNDSLPFM